MKRIDMNLMERAFDAGVRVAYVLHVQGAMVDSEQLDDEVRDFLLEIDEETKTLEKGWPSIRSDLVLDRELGDDSEDFLTSLRADCTLRLCPTTFLVRVAETSWECLKAARSEGCGSWRSRGYYLKWYAVNEIEEAFRLGVESAEERRRKSWEKAVAEGRVYPESSS